MTRLFVFLFVFFNYGFGYCSAIYEANLSENIFINKTITQQSKSKSVAEPILHTVNPKETLFGISKKYAVKMEEVRKWNKMKNDNLRIGQKLIVGYKKDKKKKEEKKAEKIILKKDTPPTPVVVKKTEPPISKPVVTEKKKEEPAEVNNFTSKKDVIEQGLATWLDDEDVNPNKYFALHRTAPVGTIIKVINGINDKSVFVKVVGKTTARDESKNIIIKISKAAALKLEVEDERFQAELKYSVAQ
jgi:rare lipoprotein A (peptidoglycan hydrolase)